MEIRLTQGDFFDYGIKHIAEFAYESPEEIKKTYELFDNVFVDLYGANSKRTAQGKEHIMPYFVTEKGEFSPENTGIIGGTSIPAELVDTFICRLMGLGNVTVNVGNQTIQKEFDYDDFHEGLDKLPLRIRVKKGQFFEYGEQYYIEFEYNTVEQKKKIYYLFDEIFVPGYGSTSSRAASGKDFIMPYFVDDLGIFTPQNTGRIGGSSIPIDLLAEFIRRFVEVDGAVVTIGNSTISGKFDYAEFELLLSTLNAPVPKV